MSCTALSGIIIITLLQTAQHRFQIEPMGGKMEGKVGSNPCRLGEHSTRGRMVMRHHSPKK